MNDRRLFYESIANEFGTLMNAYDLGRRLDIVFNELLSEDLTGMRMLDLGCGTGCFSNQAAERGADVVSVDISNTLVRMTNRRAETQALVADATRLPFSSESFGLIVCSEMLEHLRCPALGIREIERLLTPGGTLVLTTPNRRWLWLVQLGTRIGVRPYAGYENFLGFAELSRKLQEIGLIVEVHQGFHPWPFQLTLLQWLSQRVDHCCGSSPWKKWMINQAVLARKPY